MLDDIKKALRSHEMQQDSALEATAYCYAAWTDTQSQYASKEAQAWIQEQFDRVNETIDAHNAGIELNKTQATEYAEGKLDKSDLIFSEPKDDIEKKAIEERIAQLTLWNTWDRKDWAAAKSLKDQKDLKIFKLDDSFFEFIEQAKECMETLEELSEATETIRGLLYSYSGIEHESIEYEKDVGIFTLDPFYEDLDKEKRLFADFSG